MKTVIILFCIFFSMLSFADSSIRYTGEDFDLLPLTTSNSKLIEGSWTGKSIVLEVVNMQLTLEDKPYMWVNILNTVSKERRSAILYFDAQSEKYKLYVFGLGYSVPLEIMIFKYSDRTAFERQMRCEQGGYVMKIKFLLEGEYSREIELQRETCSEK